MSEYPEDVIRIAKEALGEQWCAELGGTRGWLLRRDWIAEAIMAERKRCVEICEAEREWGGGVADAQDRIAAGQGPRQIPGWNCDYEDAG